MIKVWLVIWIAGVRLSTPAPSVEECALTALRINSGTNPFYARCVESETRPAGTGDFQKFLKR